MIKFKNLSQDIPYLIFKNKYEESLENGQENIESASISSYSLATNEVSARYVNLKIIDNNKFIFFSNYNSPKAQDFLSHEQISCLIFWNSINLQLRMKAKIKKTSKKFNQEYFAQRDKKKNALSICSAQSQVIGSYEELKKNYEISLTKNNLTKCPDYWGGFSFTPYYFEFWEGHDSRLNRREVFELKKETWIQSFIQA